MAAASSSSNPAIEQPSSSAYHEDILLPFQNLGLSSKSFSNYYLPYQSHNNLNLGAAPLMSSSSDGNREQWRRIPLQNPLLPTLHTTPGNIWASDHARTENRYGECSSSTWNHRLGGDGDTGCYNNSYNENYYRNRNGLLLVGMARTQRGSVELSKRLKGGSPRERQAIVEGVIVGSDCRSILFQVMTDRYGHRFFISLLDYCDAAQLHTIFVTLTADQQVFLYVSLLKHGSSAVQGLIKKLKRTGLGQYITLILSSRFVELMTSEHGRFVVQQCLYTFNARENEVLFNSTICYFRDLATSVYGCASLNICLSCICGVHRLQLLENIAQESEFLSYDPYGNHVVQEVLMLKNKEITRKICDRLKRYFIHLALKKSGSHVVEKCIQASEYGLESVVECLLGCEKTFVILARDRFGNYVIQTALKTAKTSNFRLYQSLVALLKKQWSLLSSSTIGKYIYKEIRDLESINENV